MSRKLAPYSRHIRQSAFSVPNWTLIRKCQRNQIGAQHSFRRPHQASASERNIHWDRVRKLGKYLVLRLKFSTQATKHIFDPSRTNKKPNSQGQ